MDGKHEFFQDGESPEESDRKVVILAHGVGGMHPGYHTNKYNMIYHPETDISTEN